MNVPPVSVERVQKCVVNFEIYRFLKKTANLPHPPLLSQVISLLVGGTDILIRLEIEQSFIQLSNDTLIGWITLQ